MRWWAQQCEFGKYVDFAAYEMTPSGKRAWLRPLRLVCEAKEEGNSCMQLKPSQAQSLMDALYEAGFRPTQGGPTTGQLEALRYHLEDMRRLVFKEKVNGTRKAG